MEAAIFDLLVDVLGADLAADLTGYILAIEEPSELDEYMKSLLDFSDKSQKDVYHKIKTAKFGKQGKSGAKKASSPVVSKIESVESAPSGSTPDSDKKKSKKYRKFQLNELHQGYLKEGRHPCECQATKHKLINNCIECGRIVCEQEGSGPCFFCDNMVCTPQEEEILNSATKQSDLLYNTLNERKKSETWKKAIEERDKLLNFDKNMAQQTKIIDDEHDYYEINDRWSSKKQKEKAAKRLQQDYDQKHGSRLGSRNIVFDLVERQAFEDNTFRGYDNDDDDDEPEKTREYSKEREIDVDGLLASFKLKNTIFKSKRDEGMFDDGLTDNQKMMKNYIIQDKNYIEMVDRGMCLSMHQPWASLLVVGIKKHEGRSWYTPHRGMLWIASTTKKPDPESIQEVENFYKKFYDGMDVRFPAKYPTGCLLGNVLLQDCLDQEEYQEEFPGGESDSPYVSVCSDPNKLIVPIPVNGDHKIYRINKEIHMMAKDALLLKKRFAKA